MNQELVKKWVNNFIKQFKVKFYSGPYFALFM